MSLNLPYGGRKKTSTGSKKFTMIPPCLCVLRELTVTSGNMCCKTNENVDGVRAGGRADLGSGPRPDVYRYSDGECNSASENGPGRIRHWLLAVCCEGEGVLSTRPLRGARGECDLLTQDAQQHLVEPDARDCEECRKKEAPQLFSPRQHSSQHPTMVPPSLA